MPERVLMIELGGRGGVADYTERLVEALVAEGVDVELATAVDHLFVLPAAVLIRPLFGFLRGGTPLRDGLRRLGAHKLVNGAWFFAGFVRLVPDARRRGVAHVQGFHFPPMFVLVFALLRAFGVKVVHTPHNTFARGAPFARSRALMHRLSSRIIVHTRADLERLPPDVLGRTSVVPHPEYGGLAAGAAAVERHQARRELGLPADAPVALMFGQMRADKGIADLVQALRAVPELHAVFAGEDLGGGAELDAAAQDPGLRGRVHVRRGFQSIDAAARCFAAADATVLPYRVASQSGVLLLSYGFGRPVVVYPVGGLPEAVVDGETGWICERADVPALVAALRAVVGAGPGEAARRGEAGDRFARERFSATGVARQTIAVYRAARGAAAPEPAATF